MMKSYINDKMKETTEENFSLMKSLVYLHSLNKYNFEENIVDHISVSLNPK